MSGSPSEIHGFDAEALDWKAMAHIWRGVTSGAPSTGRRRRGRGWRGDGKRGEFFYEVYYLVQGVQCNTVAWIGIGRGGPHRRSTLVRDVLDLQ